MPSSLAHLFTFGRTLLGSVAQLIYPPTCWTCGAMMQGDANPVCSHCLPHLTTDPFPTCPRCSSTVGPHLSLENGCPTCAKESFAFDGAFRVAPYEGLLREVILRMKNWTGEELTEALAALWARQMAPRLAPLQPDMVIAVPLHWWRRWRRGFNSCDILAAALARELGISYESRLLKRTRRTAQQTAQESAAARKENVKAAFAVRDGADLTGKTVLLVDDVLTTGSTLSEAAKALRTLKPKAIYAVVLAHGR